MKKTIYKIHKYAGITLGCLIFLLAISGISLTFREELLPKFYPALFHIEGGASPLPLNVLYDKVPENKIVTNLYASSDPNEAWLFLYKDAGAKFPTMLTMNQFTGEIVGEMSMIKNFFAIMLFIHANLFLGKSGSYLVGALGFLLCVFVFSGIYLWLPKLNAGHKFKKLFQKLNIQKTHHALGLIFALPLLISGITGFLTIYDLSYSIVRPLKSEAVRPDEKERLGSCTRQEQRNVLTNISPEHQKNLISIHFCTPKSNLMKVSYGLKNQDFLEGYGRQIVDPIDGKIVQSFDSSKDPSSWNLKRLLVYPLHTGEIIGLPGRVINLFAGFALSGLFISGILLYVRRNYRRKTGSSEAEYSFSQTPHS